MTAHGGSRRSGKSVWSDLMSCSRLVLKSEILGGLWPKLIYTGEGASEFCTTSCYSLATSSASVPHRLRMIFGIQ